MSLGHYLKYPFEDHDWVKKIIIGGVISLVPIINIFTLGYFMECIRLGSRGRWVLPEWDNWGEYFMQGLLALSIILVYILIPLIISLIPGVGLFIAVLLFIAAGIMIPMALADFAVKLDFKEAFNFKEIIYKISQVINYYIAAYFVMVLISALGIFICLSAPLFAFIGSLLIFYSGVVYFNMLGQLRHMAIYG